MTAIAKITTKGQTTVPQEIRAVLGVKAGDLIAWDAAADGSGNAVDQRDWHGNRHRRRDRQYLDT